MAATGGVLLNRTHGDRDELLVDFRLLQGLLTPAQELNGSLGAFAQRRSCLT